jgi:hypothetical protein|nr:MAG TPA: intron associated endonuclease [Crassvirales sp.]
MVNFNRKLIKTVDGKKSIEGISTGNKGRLKGSKLLNKVIRNSDSQRGFEHRNCTTSTNKLKDTPIKHGYRLEDYNRLCVYEHYYDKEELPFYVGAGTVQRAFVFSGNKRNKFYNDKAININLIKVNILAIDITKEESYKLEEEYIKKYKLISNGGTLVNITGKKTGGSLGSLGNNPNSIPVFQYTKYNEFVRRWSCAKEAAMILGIDSSSIAKCCRKTPKYKTAGGYIWKYEMEIKI